MATSVLLPLDEALGASKTGGEKLSARVRRRISSRRPSSIRTSVNLQDSLDLDTVVRDSGSPKRHALLSSPRSPLLSNTNLDSVEVGDGEHVSTSHYGRKAGTKEEYG